MSFSLYCSFFVYVLLLCCILFSARGKNKDRIPVPYQKVGILHLVILAIIYLLFEKLGFDQCDKVERSGCVSTLGAECRISFAVPCTLCYMILGEAKCLQMWILKLLRSHLTLCTFHTVVRGSRGLLLLLLLCPEVKEVERG
ncbi:PREDICTED: uncharacterized protein LOC104821512 isoform X3 [Tarenaya hassleriana]|uniref:uncharacterized protein LOC104821512 isoform X3 n=1 Tax=Tarenaya hassleriana TaxID=28532 RepID=UPI00053C506E|nr:PREDICTED: uncharacterized protein LOC104821512 isoform X3 [Tarenaya hassleriana]